MRRWVWIVLVLVCILLQTTVLDNFKLFDVKPDLILILVVFAALTRGKMTGSGVGFSGGILEDFFSTSLIGVNAFVKTLLGFVLGFFMKRFYIRRIKFQILVIFFVTIIHEISIYFVYLFFRQTDSVIGSVYPVKMFLLCIYNSVLAVILFPLFRNLLGLDK